MHMLFALTAGSSQKGSAQAAQAGPYSHCPAHAYTHIRTHTFSIEEWEASEVAAGACLALAAWGGAGQGPQT